MKPSPVRTQRRRARYEGLIDTSRLIYRIIRTNRQQGKDGRRHYPRHSSPFLGTPRHSSPLLPTPPNSSALLPTPPGSSSFLVTPRHSSPFLGTPPHSCRLLPIRRHSSALLPTPLDSSALPPHSSALLPTHPRTPLTVAFICPQAPPHNHRTCHQLVAPHTTSLSTEGWSCRY